MRAHLVAIAAFVSVLDALALNAPSAAYEIRLHHRINDAATRNSIVGSYLTGQLKFTRGINEAFNDMTIQQWVGLGGENEDNFLSLRFLHHFHNPLAPSWEFAGLSSPSGVNIESSILWAQDRSIFQGWSWHDARDYYYDALKATDPDDREDAFADTFRALGQVIHLIEDASVPAHTRNDPHVFQSLIYNFETWASDISSDGLITSLLNAAVRPSIDLTEPLPGYVPIARLWDTDQYDLESPPPAGASVGIAEYTNANFVSADTIFTEELPITDRWHFPHPAVSETITWDDTYDNSDGETITRKYLAKVGDGEGVRHLVAESWFGDYRLKYFPHFQNDVLAVLDERCYEDHARFLIPRAVGYSEAALNYFFRGILYAPLESVQLDPDGRGVSLKILNKTPGEEIGGGKVTLVASFMPANSDANVRIDSNPKSVSASDLPRNEQDAPTLHFSFNNKIPDDARFLQFTVVYRGSLGGEDDAVIGHVVQPVTEQYAFAIQDRITLGGSGPSDYFSSLLGPPYDETKDNIRSAQTGVHNLWDITRQTLAGRFVAYGKIERIDLRSNPPPCTVVSQTRLYINNTLISSGTWQPGDTPEAPQTWRVENPVIGYIRHPVNPCLSPLVLEVTMNDGEVVLATDLVYLTSANQLAWKRLRIPNYSLTAESYSGWSVNLSRAGLQTPQISFRSQDLYDIIQIAGFPPIIQENDVVDDGGVEHLDSFMVRSSEGSFIGWEAHNIFCGFGCQDYSANGLYDSWNPELIPFSISGLLKRHYSEVETEYLLEHGVPPEDYEIMIEQ